MLLLQRKESKQV